MKHCPNPDCPHAKSVGRPPEYEDHVTECGDCKAPLVDGPAPDAIDDGVPLETVARFFTSHEAHIARGALASHGIKAVVDHDHGPYVSAAAWVHLRVAPTDAALARNVLEKGPLVDTEAAAGERPEPDDDMRPMRLSRRILLARWFLYAQVVSGFLAVPLTLETPLLSLALLVLAIGSLVLALWSHRNPRSAFGVGIVLETLLLTLTVALIGPVGGTGFVAILALYFGWVAAGEHPPELLLAIPKRTRSVEAEIGEAWKEVGPREPEPSVSPNWWLVGAIALGVVLLLVIGSVVKRSLLVRKTVLGSTTFELVADPEAAIELELELGLVQLAHELRRNEIEYGPLGTVALADLREDWGVTTLEVERSPNGPITIVVEIPGEYDLDEIRAMLDRSTRLVMKRVRYPSHVNDPSRWMPVLRENSVTSSPY